MLLDFKTYANNREQENQFVTGCQSGDAAAWNQLIARHTNRVYGMCYRFTRRDSEAHDMTQEVFIRVYRRIGTFRADELSFVAWLNLLTLNLLRDHYRRNRRERNTISIDGHPAWKLQFPNGPRRPDEIYSKEEARRILHSALGKLKPDLRDVILLYDVQELQYQDISLRLGIPIGTVKSRLNRARAALAHVLRGHKLAA